MSDAKDLSGIREHVELLQWAAEQKKHFADVEAKAKAAIQGELGDAQLGTLDGHVVVTWKASKRTGLSQKLLKELYPQVFAECSETTEVRTFRAVDPE